MSQQGVGPARNRGIAEAAKRFYDRGVNGIIIQSDADSRFADPDYLKNVLDLFERNPDAVAVQGGVDYEFSPDELLSPEQAEQERRAFARLKQIKRMFQFLRRGGASEPEGFSGAHMITRSYETALAGGVPPMASGEDTEFGKNMARLARERGGEVRNERKLLSVKTALRESGRTPTLYKTFVQDGLGKPKMVPNPFPLETAAGNPLVTLDEAYAALRSEVEEVEGSNEFLQKIDNRTI